MSINYYKKTDSSIWSGRTDSETDFSQFRYHQVVQCIDLNKVETGKGCALLGFASDEGVRRNLGKTGAAKGPDAFRKTIGSLCWHGDEQGFLDVGTIGTEGEKLEEAQEELGKAIHHLLSKGKTPFVIGGGHETAFGHYLGITSFLEKNHPEAKLGIVNIDAHFDLRDHNGKAHSGSPFLQAFEHAESRELDLKYLVYGINKKNNTRKLFEKADELGVQYCINRDIYGHEADAIQKVRYFLESRTHIYLTVCLDVFQSALAPGVSAPAWDGMRLSQALKILDLIKRSGKLISMDICELNPDFDKENRTAKLAGMLFSEFL